MEKENYTYSEVFSSVTKSITEQIMKEYVLETKIELFLMLQEIHAAERRMIRGN